MSSRPSGSSPVRTRLAALSLAADVGLALLSYELALVVFSLAHSGEVRLVTATFDWGIPLAAAAIVGTFLWLGLYKLEAYVSRPLHLLTLAKGALIALVITAFFSFAFKSPIVSESRLMVFVGFTTFFLLASLARLLLLDRIYKAYARGCTGGTMVVGREAEGSYIAGRCREFRGFSPVVAQESTDRRRNGFNSEPALLQAIAAAEPAPAHVFLDTATLGHKTVFDLIAASCERGADVYVVGRLVSPLDATRMLIRLFELPVMRVHHLPPADDRPSWRKRAFDVAAAASALVLLAPAFAVIALLVRRDSPGPVFYRQTRLGLHGRPFDFHKFRSMRVANDPGEHHEYVTSLIECGEGGDPALCAMDEYGRPIYKLAEDERVTRVGHFLRKYSLDELPQFWNVLRGDMSMVGPRPALEYEVAAYKPWHHRRLQVTPGLSGLWQVAGRSRVGFDEMVFQDVIYSYNQGLLTDVGICLRTVPAMLVGRGAA